MQTGTTVKSGVWYSLVRKIYKHVYSPVRKVVIHMMIGVLDELFVNVK